MKFESVYLKRHPRLEMLPLMDVMFLVLVFFVYSTFFMSIHHGIKVELPSATGAVEKGGRIVITITADSSLQFEGTTMGFDDVVQTAAARAKDGTPVLIAGDRNASLGIGIEMLSALRKNGIEKISFQVKGK